MEGISHGLILGISWHLSAQYNENHETPQSG